MPLKLLVVEDDPDGAASVRDAAIDGGFEVLVETTGEDGVAAFREQRPALVLTDLVLPDIDGIEVMRRIQQLDRRHHLSRRRPDFRGDQAGDQGQAHANPRDLGRAV